MIRLLSILLVICSTGMVPAFGQTKDPVLFTVDGVEVPVSEFDYIYSKTGGEEATYTEASLREYLDLYINFKLKVRKAQEMQLDTIPELQRELAGYRQQLADSYLMDREVTDRLVREAYERQKEDVDISHILFTVPPNASPDTEEAALNQAREARRKIADGASFEEVALAMSEDPSVEQNQGRIGFVTALFPSGFYALETAAYSIPVGEVSRPVRTRSGYHILKVHGKRPAYGEVEVAHILIRKTDDRTSGEARKLIDSLYQLLEEGASFGTLAKANSEDRRTAANQGYIGFFGIKRYELPFEEAAFGIAKDGAYSEPVETSAGWHIIRRISRKAIQPFPAARRRLEAAIKRDARFAQAQDALVDRILENGDYRLDSALLKSYADTLSEAFFESNWSPGPPEKSRTLFRLGEKEVGLEAFQDYLKKAVRQRMARKGKGTPAEAVRDLYGAFLKDYCLRYEEGRLEAKYPEFMNLMREYEEGILLFEATRLQVWDKAAQDTAGLEAFFETVKGKYRWEERARLVEFHFRDATREDMEQIRKAVGEMTSDELTSTYAGNEDEPVLDTLLVEKSRAGEFDRLRWEEGFVSPLSTAKEGGQVFYKVTAILPPEDKRLDEARGYVIADYQDYLEEKWIEELRSAFRVEVNEKTLQSLVGKDKPVQPE